MTRLIDADALLEDVRNNYEGVEYWRIIERITNAPTVQQSEPFGYFKAEPFGWTDCAETDEGAIALYEASTVQREDVMEVIKAVAHIGIDFGYGKYELEPEKIDMARKIYEAAPTDTE